MIYLKAMDKKLMQQYSQPILPLVAATLYLPQEVASELSQRLIQTFLKNSSGQRPVYGGTIKFQTDPHWRDLLLF